MFRKVLIANRGEIAVRIIRACRDLQITPIAVFSEADRDALHVRLADEAYEIGPAPSVESYLNIERIIDVARRSGAEAVHPGYGFLAENASFARAAAAAGIAFIGPSADAIELMGSKTNARRVATDAGVPVVPGSTELLTSLPDAAKVARELGYPIMLKAASGGGGKGMRLVRNENELASAFAAAGSEAAAAFGNSDVYIEKAIERPRHIEIQIFSDTHGNFVHLGERECSIQRRHQKVVEECPSPIDDTSLRDGMGDAAIKVARAVAYTGAGTIEFLVSDTTREFFFLEMNTRLQVEHAVTELVTGIDLVREQLMVAAGEPLSIKQSEVEWNGHAIECRVYAEDPDNDFLPSPGTITDLRVPTGPGIRDDGGITTNSEVTVYYDPMISKLASWGRTRPEAIDRLRRALDEYRVSGIRTTLPFFREIVRDPEFIEGKLDTGFIPRFYERRAAGTSASGANTDEVESRDIALIAAALDHLRRQRTNGYAREMGREESKWRDAGRTALLNSRMQNAK